MTPAETLWVEVREQPCEWCAVWIGPHRHLLNEDGTLGVVVTAIPDPHNPEER